MPINSANNFHYCLSTPHRIFSAPECTGFSLQEILFDSSAFQLWGTALYEQGEKLNRTKINTHFFPKQLQDLEQLALHYNQEGKGNQACFFCVKSGSTSGAVSRA